MFLKAGTGKEGTLELPMMSLRDVVMFPQSVIPLLVGREMSIKALEAGFANYGKQVFLVTQRDAGAENPTPDDLYAVGVVSRAIQSLRLPDGTVKVLFEGLYRARRLAVRSTSGDEAVFPLALTEALQGTESDDLEAEGLVSAVHTAFEAFAHDSRRLSQEALTAVLAVRQPGRLADAVMPYLRAACARKQEVLEMLDGMARLRTAHELLQREISVAAVEKRIKTRVKEQMERNQREYYLSEQIKAIHKEMGRDDDPGAEADDLEQRIKARNMPEEAREKALHEVKKLRRMPPVSPEFAIIQNYLDWILALPWNDHKEIAIDLDRARTLLESGHYGLKKPKERIIEYLAVQKLSGSLRSPILCFVGPPGVGKTSLAVSVARATGRDFVRLSLGGVRDEAEIRGHRRTYIGAMPGRIIQSLRRVTCNNPLFCLDEIDKLASDYRGDPAAALLEVLDPEQNQSFVDHYLDVDYDLSSIFFITTANSLQTIPPALQDRMEIIELHSYLETEKCRIARQFLLPRQLEQHSLEPRHLHLSDGAILDMIRFYTREAGVRNLEREIATLCRKTAVRLVQEGTDIRTAVTRQNLAGFLGTRRYRYDSRETEGQIGVCTGLAYTQSGGDILSIETSLMVGSGRVVTTGQLGDVMKESAQAAVSYVRSRAAALGLDPRFYRKVDIHIHVPDGATPKDGPSAGITMAVSLVSALLGIPVRPDVAMTGEISLRGHILPVGGIREKLLAARRSGIHTVLVPRENERNVRDVPEEIVKDLHMVYVDHVDAVLPLALDAAMERIFGEEDRGEPLYCRLRRKTAAQ